MPYITTPIQPFGSQFEEEIERIAASTAWWAEYQDDMVRLAGESKQLPNAPDVDFVPAVIKTSAVLDTNRWTYTCEPVEWDDTNKKYVTLTSTTTEFTAYNRSEALNSATIGLGYTLAGDGYTLTVTAIADDTPVLLAFDRVRGVVTFDAPNVLTHVCDAAAADAMTVPTLFVPSNGAVTSTSGTYAAITAWGDPTVIDPNVFTWTKATGLAEAGQGDYLVRWQAEASSATNDSTIGLKAQYKIDAGAWTDVPGTAVTEELSTLATYAERLDGRGYVTAAFGEDLDLRLVIARVAGTGTPTIASGSAFIEVMQVGP